MYLQSIEAFQTSIWSLISEVTDILTVLLKTNELILLNSSVPLRVSISKNLYYKKQKWKFEITFLILHGESPPTQLPIQQQSGRTHPPSPCLMTNHRTKKMIIILLHWDSALDIRGEFWTRYRWNVTEWLENQCKRYLVFY